MYKCAIVGAGGNRANGPAGATRPGAPADDARAHVHKRIAVHGSRGTAEWSMWSWALGRDGEADPPPSGLMARLREGVG